MKPNKVHMDSSCGTKLESNMIDLVYEPHLCSIGFRRGFNSARRSPVTAFSIPVLCTAIHNALMHYTNALSLKVKEMTFV